MAFPTSIDSFTTVVSGDAISSANHNALQTAITAIETKLGINSSLVSTTIDYKINTYLDQAVKTTSNPSFTGVLLPEATGPMRVEFRPAKYGTIDNTGATPHDAMPTRSGFVSFSAAVGGGTTYGGRDNRLGAFGFNISPDTGALLVNDDLGWALCLEHNYVNGNDSNHRWTEAYFKWRSPYASDTTEVRPIMTIVTADRITGQFIATATVITDALTIVDHNLSIPGDGTHIFEASRAGGIGLHEHTTLDYGKYFYMGYSGGTVPVFSFDGSDQFGISVINNVRWSASAAMGFYFLSDTTIAALGANGLKIGSQTTEKLSFWAATPTTQYNTTGTSTGFTAGAGTTATSLSTFTGNTGSAAYTVGDVVRCLKLAGFMAS